MWGEVDCEVWVERVLQVTVITTWIDVVRQQKQTAEELKFRKTKLPTRSVPAVLRSAACGAQYCDRNTARKVCRFVRAIWFSRAGVIVPSVIVSLKILF